MGVPELHMHNLLRQIIVLSPQNKPPNLGSSCLCPFNLKHGLCSSRGVRLSLPKLGAFFSLEPSAKIQYCLRNMTLHRAEGNQNASPGPIRGFGPRGLDRCCRLSSSNVVIHTLKHAG